MAEASEMSMSMSVQSAWEDLVVENPNRAKLEGCLLTTIMLVVCCIIALLVYVFVQLQPQGNIVGRQPFWKTLFYDDPPNRQFALRMLGWINWSETRCVHFSRWVCGGRGIEASSLAVYETAEMAAEDYAAEYALELIERKLSIHMKPPTEDVPGHGIDGTDFESMATFLEKCRTGTPTITDSKEMFEILWKDTGSTLAIGFAQESQASSVFNITKAFAKIQFFPLGDQYKTRADDKDAALPTGDELTTVRFPRLIGTLNDGTHPLFETVVREGVKAITALRPEMCCGENGKQIVEIEKIIVKWIQDDEKAIDVGNPDALKYPRGLEDACVTLGAKKCRFLDKKFPLEFAAAEFDKKNGANLINWMWLKFFILMAPLLPLDEPQLAGFYTLVAWYHRRVEMPHRDILCMKIIEHYYRDTLDRVIREDPLLKQTAQNMEGAIKTLNVELQSAGGSKGGPSSLFMTLLFANHKGPFREDFRKKHHDETKAFFEESMNRIVFFYPPAETKGTHDIGDNVGDVLKNRISWLSAERDKGHPKWVGTTLGAEATYDALKDRIYVPIGLAMPPYFHNDTDKIKHSVPGYMTKLLKAVMERFMKGFIPEYRKIKLNVQRAPEKKVQGISSKFGETIGDSVFKSVACFKKQYGAHMMWDLYYEKSAAQLSYQIWRTAYNHATQNKDTQLRLGYLKFISEEMIFFITAANALCHTANPSKASKKDIELAPKRVSMVLHSKLLGMSMLCDVRREVFKPVCPAVFSELVHQDEAFWTVESWRNAKKVILN